MKDPKKRLVFLIGNLKDYLSFAEDALIDQNFSELENQLDLIIDLAAETMSIAEALARDQPDKDT